VCLALFIYRHQDSTLSVGLRLRDCLGLLPPLTSRLALIRSWPSSVKITDKTNAF
jgi:hypothetical protein